MEEELLEHANGRQREMAVAKGHQEVVLELSEDLMPVLKVVSDHLCLCAGVEDLNMRPLKALKLLFLNDFLECLGDVERVPLLWCTISAILLSVGARDVDFLLCAINGVHFERGRSDILWAREQNLEILLSELRVEVHNLGQVDQADFQSGLWRLLLEDGVNDLEQDGCVVINRLLIDGLEARCWVNRANHGVNTAVRELTRVHAVSTSATTENP